MNIEYRVDIIIHVHEIAGRYYADTNTRLKFWILSDFDLCSLVIEEFGKCLMQHLMNSCYLTRILYADVVNNILKTNDRFVVLVPTAEFAVMRTAFNVWHCIFYVSVFPYLFW